MEWYEEENVKFFNDLTNEIQLKWNVRWDTEEEKERE